MTKRGLRRMQHSEREACSEAVCKGPDRNPVFCRGQLLSEAGLGDRPLEGQSEVDWVSWAGETACTLLQRAEQESLAPAHFLDTAKTGGDGCYTPATGVPLLSQSQGRGFHLG